MIPDIQILKKARELRLSGESLSEISNMILVPKSTLSIWLRDIVLTEKQISDMKIRSAAKVSRGRLNASIILKSNRIFREKKVYDESIKDFPRLTKNPFFMLGLALYFAKGTKKGNSFQFTSSNGYMIVMMRKWILKYLKVEEELIVERRYSHCSRLEIARIEILRKTLAWQKLLIQYYGKVNTLSEEN